MDKPIEVPIEIYNGIEGIREKKIDMKDYQSVLAASIQIGDNTTENWLRNNQKIYLQGVMFGLVPEGTTSEGRKIESLTKPKTSYR